MAVNHNLEIMLLKVIRHQVWTMVSIPIKMLATSSLEVVMMVVNPLI